MLLFFNKDIHVGIHTICSHITGAQPWGLQLPQGWFPITNKHIIVKIIKRNKKTYADFLWLYEGSLEYSAS